MIRVLLVIPTLDASGAEKQLTLLACGLPRDRFDVRVVALTRSGPFARTLRAANIPIAVLGKRWKADPVAFSKLRREVSRFQPHVIHSWLFAANSYVRLLRSGRHRPRVIVSERCVDSWKGNWQLWLDRRLVSRTDRLVANSDSVAAFYETVGMPRERIRVINNAIELPENSSNLRDEIRRELKIPSDVRVVLTVGRLARQKRVDTLVWAGQLLRQLSPKVLHLIVGAGPERARLEELTKHYHCDDVTRFLGHRDDSPSLYAAADAFWMASDFEGQSNSLMEAMSHGLPVIASDIPANRELICDGEDGLLVRPGDSVGFAQIADRLFADSDWATRLGRAARERMRRAHSVTHMVDAYAALYEQLASAVPAP